MLVRKLPRQLLFILLTAAFILEGCNMGATPAPTVDLNAINTAAVATAMAQISAQQTQTALAAPSSTNTSASLATVVGSNGTALSTATVGTLATLSFNTTPLAGFTPIGTPLAPAATLSLGDACNNSAYEGDVTIPDGTVMEAGVNFKKVWALRNTGTCTWDEGYALVFIGGNKEIDPYDYNFSKSTDKDFVAGGELINIAVELTAPCTPGKYQGTWRMRSDNGYFFGTPLSVFIEVKEKRKNCGK